MLKFLTDEHVLYRPTMFRQMRLAWPTICVQADETGLYLPLDETVLYRPSMFRQMRLARTDLLCSDRWDCPVQTIYMFRQMRLSCTDQLCIFARIALVYSLFQTVRNAKLWPSWIFLRANNCLPSFPVANFCLKTDDTRASTLCTYKK